MTVIEKLVGLDIDQTLNAGLVKAHLTYYNSQLGLGMSASRIEQANATHKKVFDVEEIAASMLQDRSRFEAVRAQVRESREVNMGFDVMPGAVQGVMQLSSAARGNIKFFTVRPHTTITLQEAKQTAVDWLSQKGFPKSRETTICADPKDKIALVLDAVATLGLPAILVDDTMDGDYGLMASSKSFSSKKLRDSLTFVGFGMQTSEARSIAKKHGVTDEVQVLGLASWQTSLVEGLIGQLAA